MGDKVSIYVMSDIHGLSDRFFKMIDLLDLQVNDQVYILGDVIDRGPDGIAILQYIKEQENFTLLMGNHELMMMEYYDTNKNMIPDMMIIQRWYRNGCEPTMRQFEKLDKKEQNDLLDYLHSLPLAISDLKVNDQLFYLVHGAPIKSLKEGSVYLDSEIMKLFTPADFVWNRINYETPFFDDRVVIVGHTITAYYQKVSPYAIWHNKIQLKDSDLIDIDCGCACNDENTRLCCLRLDDFKVFYV